MLLTQNFLTHMNSYQRYAVGLNILVCLLVDKDNEQTLLSKVKAQVSAEFHLASFGFNFQGKIFGYFQKTYTQRKLR